MPDPNSTLRADAAAPAAAPSPYSKGVARSLAILAGLATIVALRLGAEILIPVALAVLLTFLLHPLVGWISRRARLPRSGAVMITLAFSGLLLLGMGWLVGTQIVDLTSRLPDYRDNLREKARSIRMATSGGSGGTIDRLSGTIEDIRQELAATRPAGNGSSTTRPTTGPTTFIATVEPAPSAAAAAAAAVADEVGDAAGSSSNAAEDAGDRDEPAPVRVQVVEGDDPVKTIMAVAPPVLLPIFEAGVVVLLVIFLLLYSDDVRDRLVWLAGKRQISLTTAALDEIGTRISGFLRMSFIVNLCYGVMVGVGLALLGVPNALLWGVLGVGLRFVPFVGPWIAAALPSLLALAVFPGWARPMSVIAMFIVVETITNMVLEPWLWGGSSGISTLGVVIAAVFWSWLWGPLGLILAVPITVCLVVVGKHVPQLGFFYQLFGRERAIPTAGRLYQRLLVGDEATTREIVAAERESRSFVETCDAVFLPVLTDLKRDRAAGVIDEWQMRNALRLLDLAATAAAEDDEDEEADREREREREESKPEGPVAGGRERAPVACEGTLLIASTQNEVDDFAAMLLCRCTEALGIQTEVTTSRLLANEVAHRVAELKPAAAVVVQVAPISWPHSRHVLKALLRARAGGVGGGAASTAKLLDLAIEPPDDLNPSTRPTGEGGEVEGKPAEDATADKLGVRREKSFIPVLRRICELARVVSAPLPAEASPAATTPAKTATPQAAASGV